MNLYEKLALIQSQLKAPKGQYNGFGKYHYRSCEDILEVLKPILLAEKATLIMSDTLENIGGRFYIKATATLIDIETGELLCADAYAREEENKKGMDAAQITGSVSSYARKYALNGLFCIDDAKDIDSENNQEQENESNEKSNESKSKPGIHQNNTQNSAALESNEFVCQECSTSIPQAVKVYSEKYYGMHLCKTCQKKHQKRA